MASDTGTLELERVQEARRRLESERDSRVVLGPDDQPSADELDLDTDPATRAAQIVQEVLHAADREATDTSPLLPPAGEGPAAARARRIVEEVLAAAGEATTEESFAGHPAVDDAADRDFTPTMVRADLVLLGRDEPLVLLPGEAYEPVPEAHTPRAQPRRLGALVDQIIESVRLDPSTAPATDDPLAGELETPRNVREALRGASESTNRHGVRWVVAGAVWALAFALAGPLAYKAMVSSTDLTIELFEGDETVAEEPVVEVPEDALPPESNPNDPVEAELTE